MFQHPWESCIRFFSISQFSNLFKIFLHCADMSVNRNVWLWCELKSNFILKWLHTVNCSSQFFKTAKPYKMFVCRTETETNARLLVTSEFMGKTFQAAQLTHERFLTIRMMN